MNRRTRLLLDTHVVLWWLSDDATPSDELKVMIDEEVNVFVSAAVIWEVAIKQGLGKIGSPVDLPERIRDSELQQLNITGDHATEAGRLPLIHRDPFDRILIAQARLEGLTLLTVTPRSGSTTSVSSALDPAASWRD